MGTSKIDCVDKIQNKSCLFTFSSGRLTANGCALLCYAMIISDTSDKIKYSRIPKNTETQQENTKENTKKTTEINWD